MQIVYNFCLNKVSKITQNCGLPKVSKTYKTKELKAIAKIRGIKDYKSMSEDELLSALSSTKPVKKGKKTKTNFSKARIEKIRKEFNESRYKFSKLKRRG